MKKHGERAHSKFSASGSERWFNCPGSVELSEGIVDTPSKWAEEGTKAHEVLEQLLIAALAAKASRVLFPRFKGGGVTPEMVTHGTNAANFILALAAKHDAEVVIENRVYLDFIHPEMFGTYDSAVLDHFGTLHVFDYKYGAGVPVSPVENLQMIFYAVGVAHQWDWNFKRVKVWIIQPRIKGYDGPVYWTIPILELKKWVGIFRQAVKRVEKNPTKFVEGGWCHWCKAKGVCPLKRKIRQAAALDAFEPIPDLDDEIESF